MSLSVAMLSSIGGAGSTGSASAVSRAPAGAPAGTSPTSFADTLASMASDAIGTIKAGETTAMAGMQGKASLQQVAQSVMQAEQTLNTVVAVRDKVVGAYLEISRMQI